MATCGYPMGPRKRTPEKQRELFWAKVPDRPAGECWLWQGARGGRLKHGQIRRDWKLQYAHRVSFEETWGTIPDGMNVLHNCDVPICVNPDHLRLGTQAENMDDMRIRGRSGRTRNRRAAAIMEVTT